MANIKSQLKRIKTNRLATERNKAIKSEVKTAIRKFREAAAAGKADEAQEALKVASTKLDKAVSKGVIHKNQAANKKSAMARRPRPVSDAQPHPRRGPSPIAVTGPAAVPARSAPASATAAATTRA